MLPHRLLLAHQTLILLNLTNRVPAGALELLLKHVALSSERYVQRYHTLSLQFHDRSVSNHDAAVLAGVKNVGGDLLEAGLFCGAACVLLGHQCLGLLVDIH